MAKKNLSGAKDIDSGVLRQRRDFYALSIGLMLFHLAHGTIQHSSTFGVLPLKFSNPCWFLVAAWVGFFYFLLRYWLMSPPSVWGMYMDDARWQAGDWIRVRKLASQLVSRPKNPEIEDQQRARLLVKNGPIPMIRFRNGEPCLHIDSLRTHAASNVEHFIARPDQKTPASNKALLWVAFLRGMFLATWRERAFTDYVLPYIFGAVTLLLAVWHYWTAKVHLCVPWH